MSKPTKKQVLFLDAAGNARGSLAEGRFNALAANLGLPFAGVSKPIDAASILLQMEPFAAVVVLNRAELEAAVRERLPELAARAEFWDIPAGGSAEAAIERELSGLVARLLGGRTVADAPAAEAPKPAKPKPVHTVRVGRETAGRRGKGVTTVFDLPMNEEAMKDLAATLKQKCGTGGTVKDGRVEIQGDHRDRIVSELEKLGYKVKRSGG